MEKFSSKQRVLKSLSLGEPDRVPLDIGSTNNTTMHAEIEKKLCEYLGFRYEGSEIKSWNQQVVIPDERILKYFGADARSIYISEMKPLEEQSDGTLIDQWGLGHKLDSCGAYYTMYFHPLAKASSIDDLDRYKWPDPYSEARLTGLEERACSLGNEYCLVLEGLRETNFGLASWLRGIPEFYMDLAVNKEFAHALLDRLLDFQIKLTDFIFDKIGEYIDVIKLADDLATQQSLIISPETYREFVKPRQKILYQHIKKKKNCFILFHCCGAMRDIIPDLIEIGVDAINPVQISAAGMVPGNLKEDFGNRISFWGGGIDTQKMLPKGTPDEVKEEVKRNIEAFKPGGGYIFAPVHNITYDVPIENVIAMYETYQKYASY